MDYSFSFSLCMENKSFKPSTDFLFPAFKNLSLCSDTFSLLGELDCNALSGTIVAVPVVNIEGFQRLQRGFADGVDLNR